MGKYDVTMCEEAWRYYHITIEAPNEASATAKAEEIWHKTGALEFTYEPDEDDYNGSIVTYVKELNIVS